MAATRIWTWRTFPVTVGVAKKRLSNGAEMVAGFHIQAAYTNTALVTWGLSDVAIANGFKQLAPGDWDGYEPEANESARIDGAIELQQPKETIRLTQARPIELFDIGTFYAIGGAAGQVVLCSVGYLGPVVQSI